MLPVPVRQDRTASGGGARTARIQRQLGQLPDHRSDYASSPAANVWPASARSITPTAAGWQRGSPAPRCWAWRCAAMPPRWRCTAMGSSPRSLAPGLRRGRRPGGGRAGRGPAWSARRVVRGLVRPAWPGLGRLRAAGARRPDQAGGETGHHRDHPHRAATPCAGPTGCHVPGAAESSARGGCPRSADQGDLTGHARRPPVVGRFPVHARRCGIAAPSSAPALGARPIWRWGFALMSMSGPGDAMRLIP
jgi:hypothetical protein